MHRSSLSRDYGLRDPATEDVKCPICQDRIDAGKVQLGQHTGQHMEEIAYSVVTTQYIDWKFYDDGSSGSSISTYDKGSVESQDKDPVETRSSRFKLWVQEHG